MLLADVFRGRWRYKEAVDQYKQVIGLSILNLTAAPITNWVTVRYTLPSIQMQRFALKNILLTIIFSEQNLFVAKKLMGDCVFSL